MSDNRAWTLASRPDPHLSAGNFALRLSELVTPTLEPGQILVRNRLFGVAPTIRNSLNPPERAYRGSIPIGGVIMGMAGAEILVSEHPDYRPGDRVVAMSRWEDVTVLTPDRAPVPVFPVNESLSLEDAMGPLSPNSLTAYFGLIEVGRPRVGETVVVSAGAGSVGSVVCQLARSLGCRVIAIAGGAGKCAWLRTVCKVDETIDYKSEDVGARLAELCPSGIDIYFDNVGGDILQAAVDTIAPRGRIVLCGQISAYDSGLPAPGPRDMMKLVYGRVRMEGFVVGDFVDQVDRAREDLRRWIANGDLILRTDIRDGLEHLPQALTDLLAGRNEGTVLVRA